MYWRSFHKFDALDLTVIPNNKGIAHKVCRSSKVVHSIIRNLLKESLSLSLSLSLLHTQVCLKAYICKVLYNCIGFTNLRSHYNCDNI